MAAERGDVVRWVTIHGHRIPITRPKGRRLPAAQFGEYEVGAAYKTPMPVVLERDAVEEIGEEKAAELVERARRFLDETVKTAGEILPRSMLDAKALIFGTWLAAPDAEETLREYAGLYYSRTETIHIEARKAAGWRDDWLREVLMHELGHHVGGKRMPSGKAFELSEEIKSIVAEALRMGWRYDHAEHQQRRKAEKYGGDPDDPFGISSLSEWTAQLFASTLWFRRVFGAWPDEIADAIEAHKRGELSDEEMQQLAQSHSIFRRSAAMARMELKRAADQVAEHVLHIGGIDAERWGAHRVLGRFARALRELGRHARCLAAQEAAKTRRERLREREKAARQAWREAELGADVEFGGHLDNLRREAQSIAQALLDATKDSGLSSDWRILDLNDWAKGYGMDYAIAWMKRPGPGQAGEIPQRVAEQIEPVRGYCERAAAGEGRVSQRAQEYARQLLQVLDEFQRTAERAAEYWREVERRLGRDLKLLQRPPV